jgi:hypothetical protein
MKNSCEGIQKIVALRRERESKKPCFIKYKCNIIEGKKSPKMF